MSEKLDQEEVHQVMKAINGEGSVVNVIGEAGIGKSRLLAELKKCDVVKRVSFLESRAISMGLGSSGTGEDPVRLSNSSHRMIHSVNYLGKQK